MSVCEGRYPCHAKGVGPRRMWAGCGGLGGGRSSMIKIDLAVTMAEHSSLPARSAWQSVARNICGRSSIGRF